MSNSDRRASERRHFLSRIAEIIEDRAAQPWDNIPLTLLLSLREIIIEKLRGRERFSRQGYDTRLKSLSTDRYLAEYD